MRLQPIYSEFCRALKARDPKALKAMVDVVVWPTEGPKERDPLRLYLSDLGHCPRQIAYRMLKTEKHYISNQERDNKDLMFNLADHIEQMLVAALIWKGYTVEYQFPVLIDDRENWGGRGDISTNLLGLIEVKSARSNQFDRHAGYLPKRDHVLQAASYCHYREQPTRLLYVDRGGSNEMQEFDVADDFESLAPLMDELEDVRCSLPDLPPILPKVLKYADKKRGTDIHMSVKEVPDWRCSYCDYAIRDESGACQPLEGTEKVASLVDGSWVFKRMGERLEDFVGLQAA